MGFFLDNLTWWALLMEVVVVDFMGFVTDSCGWIFRDGGGGLCGYC